MGQSAGKIRAFTGVTVQGTYQPQGAATSGSQRSNRIQRTANTEISSLLYGTGSGYVDREITYDYTLSAGTSKTFDLYTGTDLTGLQDESAPLRQVKFLQVSILSGGDTSGVRIGGAASNEWVGFFVTAGDEQDIFPGGPPYMAGAPGGKAVTSSTKNLKVASLGAVDVTIRIVIGGNIVAVGEWIGPWFGLATYP